MTLNLIHSGVDPFDDNLHFNFARKLNNHFENFHVVFDLEKGGSSITGEAIMGNTLNYKSIIDYTYEAYLNGVQFRAVFCYHRREGSDGTLKLERLDKSTKYWVHLSQIESLPHECLKIIPFGNSLQILQYFREDDIVLHVFKVFQGEDGEISGEWDLVNSRITAPKAACNIHLPEHNCKLTCVNMGFRRKNDDSSQIYDLKCFHFVEL